GSGSWAAAVHAGAAMVHGADDHWSWSAAVDVGVEYAPGAALPMPGWPTQDVVSSPYLDGDPAAGPLTQVQARRGIVPFHARDELEVLLDWCTAPDSAPRPRIGLVHGVGGAGKTHLAAELAHRLTGRGWYAGFLKRDAAPDELRWLAGIVSPLVVVIDYAEAAKQVDVINLLAELRAREQPACVLLTARSVGDWWTSRIHPGLQRRNIPFTMLELGLPSRHPRTTGVFRTALRAFSSDPELAVDEIDPPGGRWTTLDLIMQAWLRAHGSTELPASRSELYEKILVHEFQYWQDTAETRGMPRRPTRRILRAAGACLSLLTPTAPRLRSVLTAVDTLDDDSLFCDRLAELLTYLLPADPGDGSIALRPDPVADHLILAELAQLQQTKSGTKATLLARAVDLAADDEQLTATVVLSRAASLDPARAEEFAAQALHRAPHWWRPALAVAGAMGGPFATALTALAGVSDTPLPLADLAEQIPLGHSSLRNLALIATQRSLPPRGPSSDHDRAARAMSLNNLALRQGEVGDRAGALDSITEAVGHYRALVQTNPAAFLPNLAGSLNNLANLQGEVGDRAGALDSITEAVTIRRALVQTNPAAFLPDLAASLNTLAVRQSEVGDVSLSLVWLN
ncbi:MAG: hypothetical protein ACRDQ5_17350, partial [Sciscionella sp.]